MASTTPGRLQNALQTLSPETKPGEHTRMWLENSPLIAEYVILQAETVGPKAFNGVGGIDKAYQILEFVTGRNLTQGNIDESALKTYTILNDPQLRGEWMRRMTTALTLAEAHPGLSLDAINAYTQVPEAVELVKQATRKIDGWSDKHTTYLLEIGADNPTRTAELSNALIENQVATTPKTLLALASNEKAAALATAREVFIQNNHPWLDYNDTGRKSLDQLTKPEEYAYFAGMIATYKKEWHRRILNPLPDFQAVAIALAEAPTMSQVRTHADQIALETWADPIKLLNTIQKPTPYQGPAGLDARTVLAELPALYAPADICRKTAEYLTENTSIDVRFGALAVAERLEDTVAEVIEHVNNAAGTPLEQRADPFTAQQEIAAWTKLGSSDGRGVKDFLQYTVDWTLATPEAGLLGITNLMEGYLPGADRTAVAYGYDQYQAPTEPGLAGKGRLLQIIATRDGLAYQAAAGRLDLADIVYLLEKTNLACGQHQNPNAWAFRKLTKLFPTAEIPDLVCLWNQCNNGLFTSNPTDLEASINGLQTFMNNNPGRSIAGAIAAGTRAKTEIKPDENYLGPIRLSTRIDLIKYEKRAKELIARQEQDLQDWREKRGYGTSRTPARSPRPVNRERPSAGRRPIEATPRQTPNQPTTATPAVTSEPMPSAELLRKAADRMDRLGDRYVGTITSPDFYLKAPSVLDRAFPPMDKVLINRVEFQNAAASGNYTQAVALSNQAVVLLREARNLAREISMESWMEHLLETGLYSEYYEGVKAIAPLVAKRNGNENQHERQVAHETARKRVTQHSFNLTGEIPEIGLGQRLELLAEPEETTERPKPHLNTKRNGEQGKNGPSRSTP